MLFPLLCICTYLLLVFPTGIASLVAQPQATSPYRLVDANLTDVEGLAGANDLGRISPLTASWCRAPDAELDLLFSTQGGQPMDFGKVIYAVGVLREVISDTMKVKGENQACHRRSFRAMSKGIVVTILDPDLAKRTWYEVHDALDVLLLCCFQKKVHAELRGTLFDIHLKSRFAGVVIAQATVPPADEAIDES